MSKTPLIGDSSDKDNFTNHRAGYGNLNRVLTVARQGFTLQAGEGAVIAKAFDDLAALIPRIRDGVGSMIGGKNADVELFTALEEAQRIVKTAQGR